jgi:hypothetical protein
MSCCVLPGRSKGLPSGAQAVTSRVVARVMKLFMASDLSGDASIVGGLPRGAVRGRMNWRCSREPLLAGVPMLGVMLAGIFPRPGLHTRPATAARSMLRETPPPPPAGDLLSCFAKKGGKEGDPPPPVGLRPTALRCSQQAAGAELALRGQPRRKAPPAGALLGGVGTGFSDAPSPYGNGVKHWPLITCISSPLWRADWR